jgi:hypothetical protein
LLGSEFTPAQFAECAGVPVGAVRVSIGLSSNGHDIAKLLELIDSGRREAIRAAHSTAGVSR